MKRKKTIVTITSVKIEADSRAFKQAASVARLGYNSIVVEKEKSFFNNTRLPFKLLTIDNRLALDTSHQYKNLLKDNQEVKIAKKAKLSKLYNKVQEIRQNNQKLIKLLPKSLRTIFGFFLTFFYYDIYLPLKIIPQASLYYLHAPYQFFPIFFLSKKYQVPFIYDAHDFYSKMKKDPPQSIAEKLINQFYLYLEKLCFKKANEVVTVCKGIAKLHNQTFGRRPIVIRNCHDSRLDIESTFNLRQKLKLPPKTFLLITIGKAKKAQALQQAFDALSKLPQKVHLVFLGQGYQEFINQQKQALKKRFHNVLPVKPNEVTSLIKNADASLILYYSQTISLKNCLPNGFFQSIAANLPLLYPKLPEIKRLSEKYQLGIPINPLKPESIRKAVIKLMSNPQQMIQFKQNLKIAKNELSWEKEEIILRNLLNQVINSK